jgi:very-short-patch-repair endonuclease
MVSKVCPVCAKTFTVSAAVADRYTVCSRECRLASTKTVICQRCGKPFTCSEKRYPRHYCSEECRRPPHYIECRVCGKTLRVSPGDTDRQFCSFACYRRSNGETMLEKTIRLALTDMGVNFIQEARMGRYSVDFLLPDQRIALEVDGTYWHQDTKRDERKNHFLQSRNWIVCRITEEEIENTEHLDRLLVERFKRVAQIELVPLQPSMFDSPERMVSSGDN